MNFNFLGLNITIERQVEDEPVIQSIRQSRPIQPGEAFQVGDRVKVKSGFNVGAVGTVEFVEPRAKMFDNGQVWVKRVHADGPCFYYHYELEKIEPVKLPHITHIYLDMDGVFANAQLRVEQLSGKKFADLTKDEFWKAVNSDPTFFLKLERIPDSYDLYAAIRHISHSFLTGLPYDVIMAEQKKEWVKKELGDVVVEAVRGKEKHLHAKPQFLLIDDLERNVNLWKNAGGVAILHKSARSTINELRRLKVIP